MKNILGYYDEYMYSRYGKGKDILYVDKPVSDMEKFFWSDKVCPFCKRELKLVFVGVKGAPVQRDILYLGDVFECPNCGWWTYKTHFVEEDVEANIKDAIYEDTRHYAITKSFDICDKTLPLEVLKEELRKKPEVLYDINPYKLEQLCKSILSDVYDCDVHHVGKRGDGGIDLIVLESNEPILVQVKCRQNPEHVELVKGVREFVGTLFIENKRRGIYISTAKKFSKGSNDIAERLITDRKLDYLEFVNYEKLYALITHTEEKKIWRKLAEIFYSCEDAVIYDNDKAIAQYIQGEKKLQELVVSLGVNIVQE